MTDDTERVDRESRRASKLNIDDWKVLIVDDQKDNLMIAREALTFHGATVETAANGKEGLAALENFNASVILLDLSMPEMSGWEMFQAVRANAKTSHIPVIALTAHVMAGDEKQVMDAGFDGYIAKPFSVATIVLQIKAILSKVAS